MNLEGEVALITGATRGIGKAISLTLGAKGATVIGTATSENGAMAISAYLAENGIKGEGKVLNVTDGDAVDSLLKDIGSNYSAPTILVNNAGITRDKLIMMMSEEDFDVVQATNLKGTFNCSKPAVKLMMRKRYGRIINITSVSGQIGNAGQTNYSASKAGQIGFTKALAREIAARNVTVNAIAAGYVETDIWEDVPEEARENFLEMIPLKRKGTPEDIAHAVAFLASSSSILI